MAETSETRKRNKQSQGGAAQETVSVNGHPAALGVTKSDSDKDLAQKAARGKQAQSHKLSRRDRNAIILLVILCEYISR